MQALGVVDPFNEPWQPAGDIAECLVAADVDVLDLHPPTDFVRSSLWCWVKLQPLTRKQQQMSELQTAIFP